MTDTQKLKGLLIYNKIDYQALAKELDISTTTLSYKINNKSEFSSSQIVIIQKMLNLSNEQRDEIFFTNKVD